MNSIKTILFVSQEAILDELALYSWALQLAKKQDAHLIVLRVLPEISSRLSAWLYNAEPKALMEEQRKVQLTLLEPLEDQARKAGISFSVEIAFGKEFYMIIQKVLSLQVDLVIKLVDSAKEDRKLLFNSQDMHLLRKCPCALLLHNRAISLPFNKVVASIDVNTEKENLEVVDLENEDSLNALIMDWSIEMNQASDNSLEVVHAWESEGEALVQHWNTDWSDEELMLFNELMRTRHKLALENEVDRYRSDDLDLQTYLPKGSPEEAIPRILKSHGSDLLVMGTLARTGVSGFIIGNTAEDILGQVHCSVLAVKPEGFESPIKLE